MSDRKKVLQQLDPWYVWEFTRISITINMIMGKSFRECCAVDGSMKNLWLVLIYCITGKERDSLS